MLSILDNDRLRLFFFLLFFLAFLFFLFFRCRRSLSLSSSDSSSTSSSSTAPSSSTGEPTSKSSLRCTSLAGDRGVFEREFPDDMDELIGEPIITLRTFPGLIAKFSLSLEDPCFFFFAIDSPVLTVMETPSFESLTSLPSKSSISPASGSEKSSELTSEYSTIL